MKFSSASAALFVGPTFWAPEERGQVNRQEKCRVTGVMLEEMQSTMGTQGKGALPYPGVGPRKRLPRERACSTNGEVLEEVF